MTVAGKIWHEDISEMTGIRCLSPSDTLLHKVFEVLVLVFCLWSIFLAVQSCDKLLETISGLSVWISWWQYVVGDQKNLKELFLHIILSSLIVYWPNDQLVYHWARCLKRADRVIRHRDGGAGRRLIFEARSLTDCCNRRQTAAAHLVSVFGVV